MKQDVAEHIKQVAVEAARTVLQDAAIAKSAFDKETSMNIRQIQVDIGEIKDVLKTNMVSKEEFKPICDASLDHEIRIRAIEKWMWGAIAVISVAEAVIGFLTYLNK